MAITKAQAESHVTHAVPGYAHPLGVLFAVNAAGRALISMHAWSWLLRPPAAVDLVAGQEHAALPADLAALESVEIDRSVAGAPSGLAARASTVREILARRSGRRPASGELLWAVAWSGSTPRLELHPTPAASAAGALLVAYRAGWTEIASEADGATDLALPAFCEQLYLEILTATARALDEEDVAGLDARLEPIRAGACLQAARRRDGGVQTEFGPIEGGVGELFGTGYRWW